MDAKEEDKKKLLDLKNQLINFLTQNNKSEVASTHLQQLVEEDDVDKQKQFILNLEFLYLKNNFADKLVNPNQVQSADELNQNEILDIENIDQILADDPVPYPPPSKTFQSNNGGDNNNNAQGMIPAKKSRIESMPPPRFVRSHQNVLTGNYDGGRCYEYTMQDYNNEMNGRGRDFQKYKGDFYSNAHDRKERPLDKTAKILGEFVSDRRREFFIEEDDDYIDHFNESLERFVTVLKSGSYRRILSFFIEHQHTTFIRFRDNQPRQGTKKYSNFNNNRFYQDRDRRDRNSDRRY